MNVWRKMPDFDEIIKNPKKTKIPTEPSVLHGVAIGLSRRATKENVGNIFTYIKRMPREFGVVAVKNMVDPEEEFISETKEFEVWADENQDIAEDFDVN